MKEITPIFINKLDLLLYDKFINYLNSREDLDELIQMYADDYISEVKNSINDDFFEIIHTTIQELLSDNSAFMIKTNKNSHNLPINQFFKIISVERAGALTYDLRLDPEGTKFLITPISIQGWISRFRIRACNYEDNKFKDVKGSDIISNNVSVSDILYYESTKKDFINIKSLEERKENLKLLMIEFNKKLDDVKQESNNLDYVIEYMKVNKLSCETLSTIKSGLILETLKESKSDDTVDIKTNISEIVNLEI